MKYLTYILLALAIFILPSQIYAANPVVTGDYFDVDVKIGTQSPWTKSVPLYVTFRSNITAKRVEISWDAPDGVEIKRRHPQFISVQKGEEYSFRAVAKPSTSGTFNISGNIIDWEVDTNYASSDSVTVTFDKDLVTVPETPGYSGAVIVRGLIILLMVLAGLAGLYFAGKIGLKKLLQWLQPPE